MEKERISLINRVENYILRHESKLKKMEIYNISELVAHILKKLNTENLNNSLKKFDSGMSEFNKAVKDFGDSMDKVTKEFSSDIEESNKRVTEQERKNKENLKKIMGKRKNAL